MCRGKNLFWAKFSIRLVISGFCQISSFADSYWSQLSILSQIFNTTENFWILQNFILRMSWVIKTLNFGLNFYCDWKFLNFTKFHSLHVSSGQKCMFLSQIFNTTQNFWILSNFILWRFWVVKTLNFDQNFKCDWKFLNFTKFPPLHVPNGQKCQFLAKFSTRLKISWFCPISSFAGSEWSKISFSAKFWTLLKISGFYQFLSFAGPEWSKLSISAKFSAQLEISGCCQNSSFPCSKLSKIYVSFSQIFNVMTQNVRIFS